MILPDIHALVPHADPMVLLEQVVAADAESLTARLVIREGSLFFDEEERGVGVWIGIEYMAQAIAAYAGYQASLKGEPVRVGFLLGSRRYEANCPYFLLDSVLQIHARRVLQGENGLGAFECQIWNANDSNQTALATATLTVFQPDQIDHFLQNEK
jgi:predicted hotdog family 3-hydroxylacyl-ACP dehydratase